MAPAFDIVAENPDLYVVKGQFFPAFNFQMLESEICEYGIMPFRLIALFRVLFSLEIVVLYKAVYCLVINMPFLGQVIPVLDCYFFAFFTFVPYDTG